MKTWLILLVLLGPLEYRPPGQIRSGPARLEYLLERAIVLDLHDDTTQMILDEGYNMGESHDYGQVDISRLRQGHVSGVFMSIWTNTAFFTPIESVRRALEEIDAVRRETARHPTDLELATTTEEILNAKRQGRIAVLMGMEGGHMIDSDLSILRSYFKLGVRYLTLTHTMHTPWADSSSLPPKNNGLTDFGRDVVRELNRLGMMVDISHVSDKTFYDALETSAAPVIASHSSCRALANVPRNMSDDMLRAIARKGGVVHITYYEGFLEPGFEDRYNALKAEQDQADEFESRTPKFGDRRRLGPELRRINVQRTAKLGRVALSRLLEHFEHAVKVAGIDHVGLGSDFDGSDDQLPQGMEDASKIPNLVRGLMDRGFSDEDILKILGGNTLRVMRAVEQISRTRPNSEGVRTMPNVDPTALVALIGVFASLAVAAWQIRRQWLLNSANLVTLLVDRFNSPDWEAKRVKFTSLLLKPSDDPGRTLLGNYGYGVLGFYEHIGHLVRRGAVDLFMIHNKFAWEIVCYYQLIRSEKDLLGEVRDRHNDKTQYMELEWLNRAMVKKYRHLGTDVYDDQGRVRWMDDFIKQETTLL
jgi:membrane dipeptidase